MNILVTGASGFLGKAVVSELRHSGHAVLASCRNPVESLSGENTEVLVGDLEQLPNLLENRTDLDAAIHCAWIATPGVYLTSELNERFSQWSRRLFRVLIGGGVKKIVGVGTCLECGPNVRESVSRFAYAKEKVSTSETLRELAERAGISWIWTPSFPPVRCGLTFSLEKGKSYQSGAPSAAGVPQRGQ